MNVRNCRKCRRLFNYVMGPVYCPTCRQAMEDEFQKVKKFVQDNPGCDIHMVSDACEVDPSQIRQWIREERLTFSDDSPIGIACERCGTTIKTGRFCASCKSEMTSELQGVMPKATLAPQQSGVKSSDQRMRFLK